MFSGLTLYKHCTQVVFLEISQHLQEDFRWQAKSSRTKRWWCFELDVFTSPAY